MQRLVRQFLLHERPGRVPDVVPLCASASCNRAGFAAASATPISTPPTHARPRTCPASVLASPAGAPRPKSLCSGTWATAARGVCILKKLHTLNLVTFSCERENLGGHAGVRPRGSFPRNPTHPGECRGCACAEEAAPAGRPRGPRSRMAGEPAASSFAAFAGPRHPGEGVRHAGSVLQQRDEG